MEHLEQWFSHFAITPNPNVFFQAFANPIFAQYNKNGLKKKKKSKNGLHFSDDLHRTPKTDPSKPLGVRLNQALRTTD